MGAVLISYMCRTHVLRVTSPCPVHIWPMSIFVLSIWTSMKAPKPYFKILFITRVKIRGHKSGNLIKKITNNIVNTIFSLSLQIKQNFYKVCQSNKLKKVSQIYFCINQVMSIISVSILLQKNAHLILSSLNLTWTKNPLDFGWMMNWILS